MKTRMLKFYITCDNIFAVFSPLQNICGRKRRDIIKPDLIIGHENRLHNKHVDKRQVAADDEEGNDPFDIDVGAKIKIVEKYSDIRKLF